MDLKVCPQGDHLLVHMTHLSFYNVPCIPTVTSAAKTALKHPTDPMLHFSLASTLSYKTYLSAVQLPSFCCFTFGGPTVSIQV